LGRRESPVLINKIGVEDEPVVRLDSRRDVHLADPKNRVTMTTLLQIALSPVPRCPMEVPVSPSVAIATLPEPIASDAPEKSSLQSDVA
jgi:hypothetical protein